MPDGSILASTIDHDVQRHLDELKKFTGAENVSNRLNFEPSSNTLIAADVQKGKTGCILNVAMKSIHRHGMGVAIFSRNINADVSQLRRSIDNYRDKIKQHYGRGYRFNFPTALDIRDASESQIREAHDRPYMVMLIGIANARCLDRINAFYENNPEYVGLLNLIIDEADLNLLDCPLGNYNTTEVALNRMVGYMRSVTQFTATYLPVFAGKLTQSLLLDEVRREGRRYFSIWEVGHVKLPDDVRNPRPTRGSRAMRAFDAEANKKNLVFFGEHLLKTEQENGWALSLVNVDRRTDVHTDLRVFYKTHKKFRNKFCIVTLNNSEIRVDYTTRPAGSEAFKITEDTNLKTVLTMLKKRGETNVMVIAGAMAGRCLNFTCEDYEWFLTDMYLSYPDKSHGETLIQAQRNLGVFREDRPAPRTYCTPTLWEDILREFARQQTLFRWCRDNNIHNLNELANPESVKDPTRRETLKAMLDLNDGELPFEIRNRLPVANRKMKAVPMTDQTQRSRSNTYDSDRFRKSQDSDLPLVNDYVDFTGCDPEVHRLVASQFRPGAPRLTRDQQNHVAERVKAWLRANYRGEFRLNDDSRVQVDSYWDNKAATGGNGTRSQSDLTFSRVPDESKSHPADQQPTKLQIPQIFQYDIYVTYDRKTGKIGLSLLMSQEPRMGRFESVIREDEAGEPLIGYDGEPLREYSFTTYQGKTLRLIQHCDDEHMRVRTTLVAGYTYHTADGQRRTVKAGQTLGERRSKNGRGNYFIESHGHASQP